MKRRSIALALSVGLIATFAVMTPARAGCCPSMWVLQAIPGRRFDLCLDGTEVRSALRYKQREPVFGRGLREVLLTKPAGGADCSGAEVFRLTVDAPSPRDVVHTVVVGLDRNATPRVFDMPADLGPDSGQRVMFRHVAAAGPVDVLRDGVAAAVRVRNGDHVRLFRGGTHTVKVILHRDGRRLAGPRVFDILPTSDTVVQVFLSGNRRVGYSLLTIEQECLPCA